MERYVGWSKQEAICWDQLGADNEARCELNEAQKL